MTNLPPELAQFAALVDAQPAHVQTTFRYCLCLAMVESGEAELVETTPGEDGAMVTFKSIAGDVFTVLKPPIDEDIEALLVEQLREILDEEGI